MASLASPLPKSAALGAMARINPLATAFARRESEDLVIVPVILPSQCDRRAGVAGQPGGLGFAGILE
uniref:Uncharacterized protein n=1 Tax=Thermosporothrix sp. COM3 TaxID=2490863 RepID=A0A455SHP8_9CHLR|nr:hypothetical protein KTC_11730 [Thermosporothrix sp. COM3]